MIEEPSQLNCIALLLPDLRGGGAERIRIELAREFVRLGHPVEFVLMRAEGDFLSEAQAEFSVVDLQALRARQVVPALVRYLRQARPTALLAAMWPLTVIAPIAARLASFADRIELQDIHFHYPSGAGPVLAGVSLTVPKGARVGIVGKTGSGKSTLMDLLLGLLEPDQGRILIDGIALGPKTLAAWQARVAHVPQAIYLADCSLAENIAFAVPRDQIDMARVRRAAEQAALADFVATLPDGYHSFVGERGVRLSGGQRQRIAIARALYRNADVLVFDEATSALDSATEAEVMAAVDGLSRDLTIFLIAHRTSTLEGCDMMVELGAAKSSI